MGDLKRRFKATWAKITGSDEAYVADVFNTGGKNRLAVDANISSINVPLGKDPLPDAYFKISEAGAIGDTIRLQIAATTFDVTVPDSDLPAVDFTYTLVAADVGDEAELTKNFVTALNLDTNFNNALLESEAVTKGKRATVHITSTEYSLNGEDYERPNAGDVAVSTTGTTVVLLDSLNDRLVSRPKEVSLARDPNNPHRLGVQSISGTVRTIASGISQVLKERAFEVGNPANTDLSVNGTGTPVEFVIEAEAAGGRDKVIEGIKIFGNDGNIKVQSGNFLGLNSSLTNGLLIEVTREGTTTTLDTIFTTVELISSFSTRPSDADIISQSGGDLYYVLFDLVSKNAQITLEAGTTDNIKITVRDNLSQVDSMFFQFEGFYED